ncbi:hypothetical protein [Streptomyces sp. NPDC050504]
MHQNHEKSRRQFRDIPPTAPPLLLAGADDEDATEPHLVRGID